MNTSEAIIVLRRDEVIVVGTNMNGAHYGGLAKTAYELWGLQWGQWRGLIGKCYGFPTLDKNLSQRNPFVLGAESKTFFRCAEANPDLTFFLTKIGCGIAGYDEDYMKSLFITVPKNVVKPEGW